MKAQRPLTPDRLTAGVRTPPAVLAALESRSADDALRSLALYDGLIDFSSNDYLGFSTTGALKAEMERTAPADERRVGSTGSRLLSGNSRYAEETEQLLARFYGAEASLIFSTGYAANVGLLSCVPTRHDTILYDELCHASIIDGIRLSLAKHRYKFRHNDLEHLRELLLTSRGSVFVVTESLFSMDGDFAPIEELCMLARQHGAFVIVDEAHAVGVFGERGEGLVASLGLEGEVFGRVVTFGKGMGAHGAAVCGSETLRQYLINFSRSFMYSTAPEFETFRTIRAAHTLASSASVERSVLKKVIGAYQTAIQELGASNNGPIQTVRISPNTNTRKLAASIREQGMDVRAILSPTVAKGEERLRICLHAFNTAGQVENLVAAIRNQK